MTVRSYQPDRNPSRLRVAVGCSLAFVLVIALPVTFGCILYVAGEPAWSAMFGGASAVSIPATVAVALSYRNWRTMLRAHGRPLRAGDRIEVIYGPEMGKTGFVKFPGQGGPMTVFAKLDSSPDDETVVFQWRHVRRVE